MIPPSPSVGCGEPRPSSAHVICSAARPGSTCSQMRSTVHPLASRARSNSRSRSTLRRSFGSQYIVFRPWLGPVLRASMPEAAVDVYGKMAASEHDVGSRKAPTDTEWVVLPEPRPRRCKIERTAISGLVSTRLFPRITAEAALLDGCGYGRASRMATSRVYAARGRGRLSGTVPPLPYASRPRRCLT